MRFVKTRNIVLALLGFLLLSPACADSELTELPLLRSLGPLTLGMTEEAFKKITGVTPRACHNCARDEYTAAVYIEKYARVYPEYLYSLPKDVQGFGCKFYKGKLYLIEVAPEINEINAAKKKYTELFGPPSGVEDWENGVSWVKWQNKTTAFVLGYVRKSGDAYPLTLPVGTVHLVQYIDKPLRDALEAQEKKNSTRAHH